MMLALLATLLISFNSFAESELKIVTSDLAPYQYEVDKNVVGMTTEIVEEVLKRAGVKGTITMYPWARAYKMARKNPNTLIYSISRSPEREKMFKWIGVIAPYKVYFWKLTSRKDIVLHTLDDAKKYVSGGLIDDVKADYLIKMGFQKTKNIEFAGSDYFNIRKLYAGRIDLLPSDDVSLQYRIKSEGLNPQMITKLIKIDGISHDLYLAASLGTPDEVVEKLSQALKEFKKTKEYKEIEEKPR